MKKKSTIIGFYRNYYRTVDTLVEYQIYFILFIFFVQFKLQLAPKKIKFSYLYYPSKRKSVDYCYYTTVTTYKKKLINNTKTQKIIKKYNEKFDFTIFSKSTFSLIKDINQFLFYFSN